MFGDKPRTRTNLWSGEKSIVMKQPSLKRAGAEAKKKQKRQAMRNAYKARVIAERRNRGI